jgi:hypothetical protein
MRKVFDVEMKAKKQDDLFLVAVGGFYCELPAY